MTQAQNTTAAILSALNDYDGDNLWQDVVHHLEVFDAERTEQLDPAGRSNVVALTDGTVVRYREDLGEWVEGE